MKQHREVKALFGEAKKVAPGQRERVLGEITEKLQAHMMIEEDIFYPAVKDLDTKKTEEIVPEAYGSTTSSSWSSPSFRTSISRMSASKRR